MKEPKVEFDDELDEIVSDETVVVETLVELLVELMLAELLLDCSVVLEELEVIVVQLVAVV